MVVHIVSSFRATASTYKLVLAIAMLFSGLGFHLGTIEGAHYGVKAALLALAAAATLLIDILPRNEGRNGTLATFFTRFGGAMLAFLASWNWILSETGGDPFPFLWPAIVMIIVLLMGLTVGMVVTLIATPSKDINQERMEEEITTTLAKEYERSHGAMEDKNTTVAELSGRGIATEVLLANILLCLRYRRGQALSEEALRDMFKYTEGDFSGNPAGLASIGTFKRIRMLVQSGIPQNIRPAPRQKKK